MHVASALLLRITLFIPLHFTHLNKIGRLVHTEIKSKQDFYSEVIF